jgi:hypothetical protein
MGMPHPVQYPLVGEQFPGPDTARHQQQVRFRELLEGGVDDEAEHAVLGADLACPMPDKRDFEVRYALQHFVRTDGIEGGDTIERSNGDLHVRFPFMSFS